MNDDQTDANLAPGEHSPVWPPPPRVSPPMGPLPPLTPLEVFGLSLYWLLVVVGVLFMGAMLIAVVLVLAALVDLVRHWS